MRVAHITESQGGVLSHLEELVAIQAQNQNIIKIEILGPEAICAAFCHIHPKVSSHSYGAGMKSIRNVFRLSFYTLILLVKFKPDIIHVHSSVAGAIVRVIAFFIGMHRKVVYCPHGWAFLRHTSKYNWIVSKIELLLSYMCFSIICVSESEKISGRASGISDNKLKVVRNGLAFEILQPRHVSHGLLKVLFVGRFDRQKGFDTYLEVMSRLMGVACGSAVGDHLVDLPAKCCWPTNVKRIGWSSRAEVQKLMLEHDVLFIPSRWEGMPMTAIEAMRVGLAVFGTPAGGLKEVIQDEFTGRLFPIDDIDAATDVFNNLSREALEQFGRNSRVRFEREFLSQTMSNHVFQIYLDIVDGDTLRSLHDAPADHA